MSPGRVYHHQCGRPDVASKSCQNSSLVLELEAADFFKLDLSQMSLFGGASSKQSSKQRAGLKMNSEARRRAGAQVAEWREQEQREGASTKRNGLSSKGARELANSSGEKARRSAASSDRTSQKSRKQKSLELGGRESSRSIAVCRSSERVADESGRSGSTSVASRARAPTNTGKQSNSTSTTTTNSLPSISSSPSVSPSLVCPHLSLDDLLELRHNLLKGSPHTVGLCSKCRLDPPPNVHSPLSPMFRPQHERLGAGEWPGERHLRRGYSDQQAAHARRQPAASADRSAGSSRASLTAGSQPRGARDDSLDHWLEPGQLRRLQMSPTLRNSVEFIRRNSIESGRVVRVFKNGCPYDKPLRVCILRNEFGSLNHLLDFINGRQLIPGGARYLFHLSGQLVYSVHELKHASVYIVSGTRTFDFRAAAVLEGQLESERRRRRQHHQRKHASTGDLVQRCRDEQEAFGELAPVATNRCGASHRQQQQQKQPSNKLEAEQVKATHGSESLQINDQDRVRHKPAQDKSGREAREAKVTKAEPTGDQAAKVDESQQEALASERQQASKLTRAKSEFSGLGASRAVKQKKMVTFMDTGRGSSPLEQLELANRAEESTSSKVENRSESDLSTSEIGIQVSESIQGFLIDLPLALPARGDDSNAPSSASVRGAGRAPSGADKQARRAAQPSARPAAARCVQKSKQESAQGRVAAGRAAAATGRGARKIITISERQLSLDEMSQLKDLDHGDHHGGEKACVTIRLEPADEVKASDDESNETEPTSQAANDCEAKSAECQAESGQSSAMEEGGQRAESSKESLSKEVPEGEHDAWQYPGGRGSSATPTERPVSQSDASESFRARVTTPTPSLSTTGSLNGLDSSSNDHEQQVPARWVAQKSWANKRHVRVMGALCPGLYEPARNFCLVWVNGFAINDRYPENSFSAQQQASADKQQAQLISSGASSPAGARETELSLAPSAARRTSGPEHLRQFKPSDRFHNWMCYSRLHAELLYPAGSLVVLWSRLTHEQRYYSKHSASVTALALASLDLNLAASAQIFETAKNLDAPSMSQVHLWSLDTLQTLVIVDDEHFKFMRILSVRLRNSESSGCELSVCARDDEQMSVISFVGPHLKARDVTSDKTRKKSNSVDEKKNKNDNPAGRESLACAAHSSTALKPNQTPFLLLQLIQESRKTDNIQLEMDANKQQGKAIQDQTKPLVTFGRKLFNLWAPETNQQRFRKLPLSNQFAKLADSVAKATCCCRLSPNELLVGDSEGNVLLIEIDFCSEQKSVPRRASANNSSDRAKFIKQVTSLVSLGQTDPTVNLHDVAGGHNQERQNVALTCLSRVSGNLFASVDTACMLKFYKITRVKSHNSPESVKLGTEPDRPIISCALIKSLSLPQELGFICTLIPISNSSDRRKYIEFYAISTSNTISLGSTWLPQAAAARYEEQVDTLSVIYEGHEAAASGLVADMGAGQGSEQTDKLDHDKSITHNYYFTCSLDRRICKWDGKQLVWKSLLPSSCASMAVHPVGIVLAVGSIDGTVYVLDKLSGLLISYFPLTPVCINCLAYSKDGALLAAGCTNGSIFILPVYENGLKYRKVSIFQSPHPVVSLQFSTDNRYILTSVTNSSWQELILWDLPNFRYMRDNVKLASDRISWFDSICSGSEDVRAIWENANLLTSAGSIKNQSSKSSNETTKRSITHVKNRPQALDKFVVNLSCHRLVKTGANHRSSVQHLMTLEEVANEPSKDNFVIASDTRGFLRLFRYPCYDIQQGFYAIKISSTPVNCCRFLQSTDKDHFVSTSVDGSICLWALTDDG